MRGNTENRAEKYIRNHRNFKRWIAFALCLSLLTGTVTLYMLNKPATAMTEEGAGQVGLVLETADAEFEQGLIEQMNSDDGDDENESAEAASCENEEVTEPESGSEEATLDSSDVSDVTKENAENEDQSGKSSSSESDDEALNSSSAATLSSNDEESAKNASSASEASSAANSSSDASSAASSGASLAGTASSAASSSASLSGLASSVSSSASSETSEESDEEEIEDVHVTVLYVDNHGEEIAESKELLIEESFDITSEVNELDGYIFNKAFIGDDQIVNIVKKTGKTVTTEKPQKSEEPTDSVAAYISEDEPLEKNVEYTYYEATTSDDKVIEIKEDTDLRLVYFAVNTKEEFVYESEDVTVTVKLSKPEVLPADVELSVKTVDANTEGYNYAAYMEALNLNSEIIAAASKTEDEDTASEDNEKVLYDETNTILFDVAFMLDSVEYEPNEGSVSVSVKFNNKQISEGLEATEDDDLTVVHLPLTEAVMEEVNSTSEATEITSEDISLEIYKEGSVSLENDADVLSFETESFSITAVVKNTNNGEHTWEGTNYKSATELIEGLGNAKYFGAVADTISGNSHFEGNVAVNNYKINTQRVLFDYERTNGGYISSDEYKSYSIVVQKKSTETGTFNFALYRDEAGTNKISGSEFTFNASDFTFSDGYYVASHRIEGFTEKNPNVYVYEIDPESGNPVLDNKSYGNFTVTYESELNETGNAVDALMSSYITNGSYNESKLDEMLYSNASLYFDGSASGWKKGTKDSNNHVTIADELYDIPADFVDTILDDAKSVSSVLPYIC